MEKANKGYGIIASRLISESDKRMPELLNFRDNAKNVMEGVGWKISGRANLSLLVSGA